MAFLYVRTFPTLAALAFFAVANVGCKGAHAEEEHGEHAEHEDHAEAGHAHPSKKTAAHAPEAGAHGHESAGRSPLRAPEPAREPQPSQHGGGGGHAQGETKRGGYVVPFTWDASEEEPLARMRGFVRGVLSDNSRYATEKKPEFFKAFAGGQRPRATLVTCADSRVQSTAFDQTPENDMFTIRNIGNQILTSEGSVEYGVHHLKTPVLMIMGHSGCGAVKASMGDFSKESEPLVRELSSLSIPKPSPKESPEEALTAGVIANVHSQVSLAVMKFGEAIEKGDLTVIGAVYDFRNDLSHGFGKVTIVDVNGQTDAARIDAFTRAMSGPPQRTR